MSETTAGDTPTGMQPYHDAGYLIHQEAHPHVDEYNQPIRYGLDKPDPTFQPFEFLDWKDERAETNKESGSPLPPGEVTPS